MVAQSNPRSAAAAIAEAMRSTSLRTCPADLGVLMLVALFLDSPAPPMISLTILLSALTKRNQLLRPGHGIGCRIIHRRAMAAVQLLTPRRLATVVG